MPFCFWHTQKTNTYNHMFEKVDLEIKPRNKVFRDMEVGQVRELPGYKPSVVRAMLRSRMKRFINEAYSLNTTDNPLSFRRDS